MVVQMHQTNRKNGRRALGAVCLLLVCLAACSRQEAARRPATACESTGALSTLPAPAPSGSARSLRRAESSTAEPLATAASARSTAAADRPAAAQPAKAAPGLSANSVPSTGQQSPAPLLKAEATTLFQTDSTTEPTAAPTHAPTAATAGDSRFLTDYETQVVALVNAQRAQNGLSPLAVTAPLRDTAHLRAVELTQNYSHTRPDGTRCFTAFPESDTVGENAARGQQSPAEAMQSWMNSKAHRENIMNPAFSKIGVGCIQESGTIYWVQCFTD